MLWRKVPERVAKVGVEGSNPFARSNFSTSRYDALSRFRGPRQIVRV